jgi:dynein heavy chain, axonemal
MFMQEAPPEGKEPTAEEAQRPVSAEEEDYSMSPEDLERRLSALRVSATFTVFDFTRRGLFDRDKLIVTCLLTLQVPLMLFSPYQP